MSINPILLQIRAKKLGLLIYDARLSRGRTIKECAEAISASQARFRALEAGESSPSLPELEALAFFLDVPLEHFWGSHSIIETNLATPALPVEQYTEVRERIIATTIKLRRTEMEMSLNELSEKTGISDDRLRRMESGGTNIPLPELEVICSTLGIRLQTLFTSRGRIGSWRNHQELMEKFLQLPPHIQEFICKPINRPYLDLAIRLNDLDVVKLRMVAEGLLEITY